MNEELEKIKQTGRSVASAYGIGILGIHQADFDELIDQAFQAGVSSTIAKIREGMPTREKACEHPDWGYVEYHDLMEKNINDVENGN